MRRTSLLLGLSIAVAACGGGGSTGPRPTGTVHATIMTTGHQLDPDGYTLHVDTLTRSLPDSGSAFITGLTPGNVQVQVTGIASNCAAVGSATQEVHVVADSTTNASLAVTCDTTFGGLKVVFTTTGGTPDSNGYLVAVDSAASVRVADADSIVARPLSAGSHTLHVTDVSSNCSVGGGASRSVAVPAGRDTVLAVTVSCPTPTTVTFHVTTTGSHLDPDGYTIAIDSGASVPVSDSGTLGPIAVTPGAHTIAVGGVVMNCMVSGGAVLPVSVPANANKSVAVAVSCAPPALLVRINGYRLGFVNPDGSNMDTLALFAWPGFYPAWSPDRSAIVFMNGTTATVVTPSGGLVATLPFDVSVGSAPRWSPDGSELLVERTSGISDSNKIITYHNLYRVTPAGVVVAQVTHDSTVYDGTPSDSYGGADTFGDWSPDGSHLVFVHLHQDSIGGHDSLVVTDTAGGDWKALSIPDGVIGPPRWSPDGSTIVFPFDGNGQHGLGSVHSDGTGFAMIGTAPPFENGVTWSPDGSHLAIGFLDPMTSANTVRIMATDGSDPHDFTIYSTPDWR